jgi:hypothetical protein
MQPEHITQHWWGKHIDNPEKLEDAFVDRLVGAPRFQRFVRDARAWPGAPAELWKHAFRHVLHNVGFWLVRKAFKKALLEKMVKALENSPEHWQGDHSHCGRGEDDCHETITIGTPPPRGLLDAIKNSYGAFIARARAVSLEMYRQAVLTEFTFIQNLLPKASRVVPYKLAPHAVDDAAVVAAPDDDRHLGDAPLGKKNEETKKAAKKKRGYRKAQAPAIGSVFSPLFDGHLAAASSAAAASCAGASTSGTTSASSSAASSSAAARPRPAPASSAAAAPRTRPGLSSSSSSSSSSVPHSVGGASSTPSPGSSSSSSAAAAAAASSAAASTVVARRSGARTKRSAPETNPRVKRGKID